MLTLAESRDAAATIAAEGHSVALYHAPTHRDDWDDDNHAYGYQLMSVPLPRGATLVDIVTAKTDNPERLTRKQIAAMQTEAGTAGDHAMVDICERALDGCPIALAAVAKAIDDAAAMIEGGAA